MRSSIVVQQFSMAQSEADHSVSNRHSVDGCTFFIVYVDDTIFLVVIIEPYR